MASPKELIVVAGANGTGKTTFAHEYVAEHGVAYLGADAIAETISPADPTSARFQADRQFVTKVDAHLRGNDSFLIETTLSGVSLRKTLKRANRAQFVISIFYLFVDSPETCISRIEHRVRKGGHFVPENDVRRRFSRSLRHFWSIYRGMAHNWVVMYNAPGQLEDVVGGSHEVSTIRNRLLFAKFRSLLD